MCRLVLPYLWVVIFAAAPTESFAVNADMNGDARTGPVLGMLPATVANRRDPGPLRIGRGLPARGRVRHIQDGNTVSILIYGRLYRLTLARIVAPRPGQAMGMPAKRALGTLCFNALATVYADVAVAGKPSQFFVHCRSQDAGLFLLRQGLAELRPGETAPEHYRRAAGEARNRRLGVWRSSLP